jgi:hypothetical protein
MGLVSQAQRLVHKERPRTSFFFSRNERMEKTTRCLLILEFDHWCGWKNDVLFLTQKCIFDPKYLKKHLKNLVKPFYSLQKCTKKNNPKTLNQPETKKLSELRYVFIGVFKVKKDLNLTLLIMWNILT